MAPNAAPTIPGTELAPRLRLAVVRLARLLRKHSQEQATASQLSALVTVERAGPITLGDLAGQERVQPPTMTRIVAGLEEQGLLARETDLEDRRVSRVSITAQGRKLLERIRRRKTAFLAARLDRFTPEERDVIARAAELLERMVEEES
jgi:DNA-binding MarR family transcriptional regulator